MQTETEWSAQEFLNLVFLSILDILKSDCFPSICLPMPEGPGTTDSCSWLWLGKASSGVILFKNHVVLFLLHLLEETCLCIRRAKQQ